MSCPSNDLMLLSWGLSARYVSWCLCPSGHRLVSRERRTSFNIGRQCLTVIVTTYDSCVVWHNLLGPAPELVNDCSICRQHIYGAKLSVQHKRQCAYQCSSSLDQCCVTVEHMVLEWCYRSVLDIDCFAADASKGLVRYHVPNLFWLAYEYPEYYYP